MIIKLMTDNSPMRPAITDSIALAGWRDSVLSELKKKIPKEALIRISEKLLNPQQWKATASTVTKGFNIAAEDEMNIEGIANGADPDRGRELILSSAWKTANYDLNPIILFNHNHNWPIGICTEYRVEDQGLYYRGLIGSPSAYPCLTETQQMCRSLLAQGILKASSVGFLPLNIDYDEVNDILRYTEVELLEISLVSIPMQQGSLLDSVGPAAKSINTHTIKEGVKGMDKAQFDEMMAKLTAIFEAVTKPKEEPPKPPMQEDGCGEPVKSLLAKINELETSIKKLSAEKEETEKLASDLVDALQKQGIKL